jgi:hypothetical protein
MASPKMTGEDDVTIKKWWLNMLEPTENGGLWSINNQKWWSNMV